MARALFEQTCSSICPMPALYSGKDPLDPNSRRPIALSSTLAKISESLIKHRIDWLTENGYILANTQFGFRKGMGTMGSLSLLITDIEIAFKQPGRQQAAYDNILLPVLKGKLNQLGLPEKLVQFIHNLLVERSVVIKSNSGFLPRRIVWKGLPQGSVLSSLLYNLYTYETLNNPLNVFVKSYNMLMT